MKIDHPTRDRLPELKALWREAFRDGEGEVEAFFTTAFSPDRCRIVTEGGNLAAMLYWLDGEYQGQTYAYLYAVATCREFQGRGICRALMEDTLSFLAGNRYAGAVLYPASEGLRAMYEKMGFQNWGRGETFPCAAGEKIPVRRIAAEEYADLRRRYLPEDGLRQEGASLALLEKTTGLYAGDSFLLAANREGETLNAQELLGDRSAAPGILAALGCGKGTFRRGAAVMGRILKADAPTPGYVGLVFD